MSWGDFEAVASWRGVDGIITQLKTLGTYGALLAVQTHPRADTRDRLVRDNCIRVVAEWCNLFVVQ